MQFDTLDYAKKLESAGVPAPQAEAQAKALGEVLARAVAFPGDLMTLENNLTAKLAAAEARLDAKIAAVEGRLDAKIDAVRTELDAKIEAVRLDLSGKIETLKWMFGALVALNIAILARLLFLH